MKLNDFKKLLKEEKLNVIIVNLGGMYNIKFKGSENSLLIAHKMIESESDFNKLLDYFDSKL